MVEITSNRLTFNGPLPTEVLDEIAAIIDRHMAIERIARDPMADVGFVPKVGGTFEGASCESCGTSASSGFAMRGGLPRCNVCGGVMRFDAEEGEP